jgi:hypothetical protein
MRADPGISQQGCVDSKEVWMTWEVSAAANAVLGIAYLVISYSELRRQRPATVAEGDAPSV